MKKQESHKQTNDIFGLAIANFYLNQDSTDIIVHSPDFDDDIIPVHYLFRDFKDMPLLERKALDLCRGKILDVGCGAGSHALYLQQIKKLEVTPIDISAGAIKIAEMRGVKNAREANYFDLQNEKFDTLLFLMNGTGIIGKLKNLDNFFNHSRKLLAKNGRILIDSSDLRYLFDEDEDGGIWIEMDADYYGELEFSLSYKDQTSAPFDWLYLDFNMLEIAAEKNGFSCELIQKGEHYDYIAELKISGEEV